MADGDLSRDSFSFDIDMDAYNSITLEDLGVMDLSMSSPSTSLEKRRSPETDTPNSPKRTKLSPIRLYSDSPTTSRSQRLPSATLVDDPNTKRIIIAQCPLQKSVRKLSYGVQFEIARLLSRKLLSAEEISEDDISHLQGTNAYAAPKTARRLVDTSALSSSAFADEIAARSPWSELDKEEDALAQDQYAGLGLSENFPDWYGGKVEFRGKLVKELKGSSYEIVLERCTLGPSCRFMRRFGSWRFLRIKVPQNILYSTNNLVEYFKNSFFIWGREFKAIFAKEDTVFLFETRENDKAGMSVLNFLEWFNPPSHNDNQLMCKWASRFALGFSTSVPGIRLDPTDVFDVDDIYSNEESCMTDGCGFGNMALHLQLRHNFKWDNFPTAFQFRMGGSKGLILLRPNADLTASPQVWIRPSQKKIQYSVNKLPDPANCIIDVLRPSHMRTPARVSAETIQNLEDNGVPHRVFLNLFDASIEGIVKSLTTWDGPKAMANLWYEVEKAGSVLLSHRVREAAGEARARGFGEQRADDEDDEDELGEDSLKAALDERSTAWCADIVSGCPSSLEETVMVLLEGGFSPQKLPVLREKLKNVVASKIKARTRVFRFDVPQSASALVVPDPLGILGVDEIQIKNSKRNLLRNDGLETDVILGDVLITRNPCKVPTDIRKVKAVEHSALREYVDVIVCSIQGHRRLLDFLAGGDYDGDICTVLWASSLVLNFSNADEKHSIEPANVGKKFTRDNVTVKDFRESNEQHTPAVQVNAYQTYLLSALRDTSLLGKYSVWHDNAIHKLGYSHPHSIGLGYTFNRVMDSPKTGYRLLEGARIIDQKRHDDPKGPDWKYESRNRDKNHVQRFDSSNTLPLRRSLEHLNQYRKGPAIMSVLNNHYATKRSDLLSDLEEKFAPLKDVCDYDLTKPWQDAIAAAEKMVLMKKDQSLQDDLNIIYLHVQEIYALHRSHKTGKHFTQLSIELRQDTLRDLSQKFAAFPQPNDLKTFMDEETIARLRASYAYLYDFRQNGWSRFPWNVAMRQLCLIKSNALGPFNVVTKGIHDHLKVWKTRKDSE